MTNKKHNKCFRKKNPTLRQVRVWPERAMETLQDYFKHAVWDMLKAAAIYNNQIYIDEYAMTVLAYISKCLDYVSITEITTTGA